MTNLFIYYLKNLKQNQIIFQIFYYLKNQLKYHFQIKR